MSESATPSDIQTVSFHLCAPEARKFILAAAILASSLGFIDGSMVAIALPAMRESLGASLVQAQWVSNAYMLALSAIILVGGSAGDRFGLVRVFSGGIALFVLASIACTFAPSAEFLIAARGLQGLGAAFMVPGSLALISRAYPEEERGRAIGIWAAAAAVTSGLGPVLGGFVVTFGSEEAWRWLFAINLPLGGIALYILYLKVSQDPAQPERGLDIPGAVLAVTGLGLIAWSLTGAEYSDGLDPTWIYYFSAGMIFMGAFLVVEALSPHPMMPLGIWRNLGFSAANVVSFLIYFCFSGILFYLPMATIGGFGVSELETSAAYLQLSVFIAAFSGLSGKLADKYGPRPLLVIGSLVLATAYLSVALAIQTQNFWYAILPAMCLQGLGMGLVVAPVSTAVMGSVESHMTGVASGSNNAVTRMAGLIAVAAMGSVAAFAYGKNGGPATLGAVLVDPVHAQATADAFQRVAFICCLLCVISAVISALSIAPKKAAQS